MLALLFNKYASTIPLKNFIHFLFLLLMITGWSCNSSSASKDIQEGYYSIKKIVDGDTFYIDDGDGSSKGEKIRLIGIDAPESRRSRNKEIAYFGKEAKQYLTNLLEGRKVKLEFDIGKYDRYQRTLAYVYLEDGTFLNAEMVKQGYAVVMTVPPNVKFAQLFLNLEQQARKNGRGLWDH